VADRLESWLKSDPLVAGYRERLKALPTGSTGVTEIEPFHTRFCQWRGSRLL
jgi:hypothetical protein